MNLFSETFKMNEQNPQQLTSDSKAAAPAKRTLFTVTNRGILNLIASMMRTSDNNEIMKSQYFLFSGIFSHHILTKNFGAALSHPHVNFKGSTSLV